MDVSLFSKQELNTSLLSSLSYIYSELNKSNSASTPFDSIVNSLSPNWVTFGLYNMLIDTVEDNSIEQSKLLLDDILRSFSLISPSILVAVLNSEYSLTKTELITRELSKHSDKVIKCGELDSANCVHAKTKIKETLDLIQCGSPLLWSLLSDYVDEIVLTGSTNGHYVQSAASFNLFGLVIINGDNRQDVDFYLEHIIHELAHIILYTVNAKESVVLNGEDERFQAPYRADLRPMDGIYHAYFVMSYIIKFLRTLVVSRVLNETLVDKVERRISITESQFVKTHDMMVWEAKFTPIGRKIFDDAYTETIHALSNEGSYA
ncbi:aKG-HExxH-type peptide beta-hydroxylase [Vibrio genomosp. F10]|uniref:aKG-HExxH-type peptide beta-hydroxylase n=1 Tax=Vibrio genomosp. F10 TaxID=723171 RepID=UPI0002D493AA|nr:HEXXH motif-containing putative peptide modification protein [Vibrio genomosp. F10]OEF09619.1 hypothetical protein A1QK_05875 [Vibrio genomosp. F10 str. 9ZD137]